jgi:hypothetical protein
MPVSITRHHNEWLKLVPNSGPFLSLPVLSEVFPQGLDAHDADHARRLRLAYNEWDDNQLGKRPDPALHRAWQRFVLAETLGFDELLAEGQAIPQTLKSEVAEYGETLRPDWIVCDPETKKARLLVQVYPRSQSLTKPVATSRWKTSPDTRMMQLLHDTGIRLGLVTNGDHFMLVNAPKNEATGYASFYANLWLEEEITLRAFRSILGAERLFGVPSPETLEALLDKSAKDQQEVTDQLGYQVRKAVEVLIHSLDKADQEHGRKLFANVSERVLYESALTVMMRLVFLFCAEERELLLLGDDLYDKNYSVSTLREQLRTTADQFGEEILGLRYDAWTRLLTTFRAVYAGVQHDQLRLPAYGGSLFNPDRFPFLEGRSFGTSWKTAESTPLPVNNRTVLHLLQALQVLQTKVGGTIEARSLSFRSLDIEQIGHVYEGLLDHTARRATEPVLGLQGTRDKEPEIALAQLEKLAAQGEPALLAFLNEESGRSESALKKSLHAELDDHLLSRFRTACQDAALWQRVKPFAGLVRLDDVDYPIVIPTGSVYVTSGTDRRSSGTHYTPKTLTEPIVQYTLEPLVYVGPAEGLPKESWQLRSAQELLDLKVCDMACGSGAFLVQACRYLAARLLEAWDAVERAHPGTLRITPEGKPASGQPGELLIPDDPEERQTFALRIIAQRCLYGVDKNPLAVEMAKLSLWLLTLAKDKPFEFLDHAIRCGDSLVGIHNTEQLRKFNLDGQGEDNQLFLRFLDEKIKEAIALRRQITEMQVNNVEDVEAQDRKLHQANEQLNRLKCAADMLIAAEFVPGSATDKRAARDNHAIQVALHFHDSDVSAFQKKAQQALAGQVTFHWPLEFPEVLVERGGFDAFVGNPPFMAGRYISGQLGTQYALFIFEKYHQTGGQTDLCAYFFRRVAHLLNNAGKSGILATNSISEGDTRRASLEFFVNNNNTIYRANKSFKWPGSASLHVSSVHLSKGSFYGEYFLDGYRVTAIDATLSPVISAKPPLQLLGNLSTAFKGTGLGGDSFLLEPGEANRLQVDPHLTEFIKPYIGGQHLVNAIEITPSHCCIDFGELDLCDLLDCRALLEILVLRQNLDLQTAMSGGVGYCWWRHRRSARQLYHAIEKSGLSNVVCKGQTSKAWAFARLPASWVFDQSVIVFVGNRRTLFANLQSSIHEEWILRYSSTHETRRRYSPSDCFENFPLADESCPLLELQDDYELCRCKIMRERQEGLTLTYNRFHDSDKTSADIQKLRTLHVEMDHAVAAAYGWTDLELGHGFHETKQGVRYTICEGARREVLARLLKLNHERYAEEVRLGLHEKKGAAKKPAAKKAPGKSIAKQATLFDLGEDSE